MSARAPPESAWSCCSINRELPGWLYRRRAKSAWHRGFCPRMWRSWEPFREFPLTQSSLSIRTIKQRTSGESRPVEHIRNVSATMTARHNVRSSAIGAPRSFRRLAAFSFLYLCLSWTCTHVLHATHSAPYFPIRSTLPVSYRVCSLAPAITYAGRRLPQGVWREVVEMVRGCSDKP